MPNEINDPILKRFRAALDEMYGARLERVVLFGSRVRGDAHEDSDYDVAVFLRDLADRPTEMNRLADLGTKIIVEDDGPFIHAMSALRLLRDVSTGSGLPFGHVCASKRFTGLPTEVNTALLVMRKDRDPWLSASRAKRRTGLGASSWDIS
jgi:predicted nucleotidyltransferase